MKKIIQYCCQDFTVLFQKWDTICGEDIKLYLVWPLTATQIAHLIFSQAREPFYRKAYITEVFNYHFPQSYLVLMKGQKQKKWHLFNGHICAIIPLITEIIQRFKKAYFLKLLSVKTEKGVGRIENQTTGPWIKASIILNGLWHVIKPF